MGRVPCLDASQVYIPEKPELGKARLQQVKCAPRSGRLLLSTAGWFVAAMKHMCYLLLRVLFASLRGQGTACVRREERPPQVQVSAGDAPAAPPASRAPRLRRVVTAPFCLAAVEIPRGGKCHPKGDSGAAPAMNRRPLRHRTMRFSAWIPPINPASDDGDF